jgi:fused signal recognition particle receptor
MILWWGKKKQPDPRTGETPAELLKPGETPASLLDRSPAASLDKQIFGEGPINLEPELGDDPLGIRKAAERIAAEKAAEAAARDASVLQKLSEGLRRSSSRLAEGLAGLSKRKIDRAALDELEELLITSDMGTKVAARIAKAFSKDRFDREVSGDEIKAALADEIAAILKPREQVVDFADGPKPRIVLFVGVNGSGKTTTIGKIAAKLSAQGADIVLAAGDTFRAAAVEQLRVWAERANARFISKPQGADAAGLAYEAVELAKKEDRDLALIDTAGRLQNKTQLMDELAKVVRAIRKIDPTAPHDVILVLDATVGQNALGQVEAFRNTAGVTGLVMTKLDGTAKGGVLVAIAEQHSIPIHFVGVGEKAEDLHPFSADTFARALVGLDG